MRPVLLPVVAPAEAGPRVQAVVSEAGAGPRPHRPDVGPQAQAHRAGRGEAGGEVEGAGGGRGVGLRAAAPGVVGGEVRLAAVAGVVVCAGVAQPRPRPQPVPAQPRAGPRPHRAEVEAEAQGEVAALAEGGGLHVGVALAGLQVEPRHLPLHLQGLVSESLGVEELLLVEDVAGGGGGEGGEAQQCEGPHGAGGVCDWGGLGPAWLYTHPATCLPANRSHHHAFTIQCSAVLQGQF